MVILNVGGLHHVRLQLLRDRGRSVTGARFGAFSAFIVALFAEMYGFPLTIYLLSGWLGAGSRLDPFSHDAGHLWYTLLGLQGNPHLSLITSRATSSSSAASF